MITAITTRRVPCRLVAAALLAAGCTTPFCRLPRSPDACQDVGGVAHMVEPDGQQRFELVDFASLWEQQRTAEWCWAACATMIHHWQGDTSITQDDIVDRIRARLQEDEDAPEVGEADEERLRAASEHELLLALAPDRKDLLDQLWDQCAYDVGQALGEQLAAQTDEERAAAEQKLGEQLGKALVTGLAYLPQSMDLDTVLADLQDGYPVVVGLQETDPDGTTYGHACVIYGITATWRAPDGLLDGMAAMGNAFLGAAGTGYGFKGESGYTYLTVTMLDPAPPDAHGADREAKEAPGTRTMSVAELLERADFFASRPFAERVLDTEAQSLQQPPAGAVAAASGPYAGGGP